MLYPMIPLVTLTLIASACFPLSQGFSWVYAPLKQGKTSGMPQTEIDGGLPPGEVAAILQGSRSLDSYSRKPDCFRRAAIMLQTRCGDLETDEHQRVRAAISMTLCEIATGEHASPPLECEHFRSDLDSNDLSAPYPEASRKCVSALSRSAQYWSSYSGYLREVAQLCYAYQRWNDIDTAKEVHRNTTRQAMNVLQYLTDREKHMERTYEDSKLIVAAVLEQMVASSTMLDVTSAAASGTLRRVLDEISEKISVVILEAEQRAIHDHMNTMSRMDANISQVLGHFFGAMDGMAKEFERTMMHHLDSTFSQIGFGLQNVALLADGVNSKFVALEKAFGELHHATGLLIMDARQAGADVEAHLRVSHMVLEKQLMIASISDSVSSTLSELVIKTQAGMQDLNVTVAEIKDNLSKSTYDNWTTATWYWFQEVMLRVLQVHPSSFQHPVFQAIYHGFRIFRVLSLCFSSGLMSLFMLLVSIGNLLSRYLRGRGGRTHSDQPRISVIPEAARVRTTIPRSPAMQRLSLDMDWDFAQSGYSRGPSLDAGYGRLTPATSGRYHTRLSRIPERLCRPFSR